REVVDRDHPDAAVDQVARPAPVEPDEVPRELVGRPELRVARLEEDALRTFGDVDAAELLLRERLLDVRGVDDGGRPEERLERERLGAGAADEEVRGRVDVRARVGAEVEAADVRSVAP